MQLCPEYNLNPRPHVYDDLLLSATATVATPIRVFLVHKKATVVAKMSLIFR